MEKVETRSVVVRSRLKEVEMREGRSWGLKWGRMWERQEEW